MHTEVLCALTAARLAMFCALSLGERVVTILL